MSFSAPAPEMARRFRSMRELLASNAFAAAPGVYDALSARLAEREGCSLAYASGGSIVRSLGLPDLGLADLTEMATRFTQIAAATRIPVIADGDNGFGNELNITRTVPVLERTGIAAVHFEDQVFPKRCGHDAGVQLIAPEAMATKLAAALAARTHANVLIIARTDAVTIEGLPRTIERARRYADTGVDMLFVEGLQQVRDIEAVGRALALPKLLNCGPPGTPLPMPAADLAELGFRIGIFPADLQCAAIAAMAECLRVIGRDGHCAAMKPRLATLGERDALVDAGVWQALATH